MFSCYSDILITHLSIGGGVQTEIFYLKKIFIVQLSAIDNHYADSDQQNKMYNIGKILVVL